MNKEKKHFQRILNTKVLFLSGIRFFLDYPVFWTRTSSHLSCAVSWLLDLGLQVAWDVTHRVQICIARRGASRCFRTGQLHLFFREIKVPKVFQLLPENNVFFGMNTLSMTNVLFNIILLQGKYLCRNVGHAFQFQGYSVYWWK